MNDVDVGGTMTIEFFADIVWIVWTAVGLVIQGVVMDKARRDLNWIQLSVHNGQTERDAREAFYTQVIFFSMQASMFLFGVWRLSLEPDPNYYYRWDPPNKFVVGTMNIMVVSSLLLWESLRNLRLRRTQTNETRMRQAGQMQTRKQDEVKMRRKDDANG